MWLKVICKIGQNQVLVQLIFSKAKFSIFFRAQKQKFDNKAQTLKEKLQSFKIVLMTTKNFFLAMTLNAINAFLTLNMEMYILKTSQEK